LDRLRAQLSALLTYRTVATLLGQMFPVDAGQDPESLRRHTFKVAQELPRLPTVQPATSAEAIVVTLDSTFVRSCEAGERHLEVRIGNVETTTGRRRVFGAVAKTDTDPAALVRGSLDAVGRTDKTILTAFADGCPGLRAILADAGVTTPPITRPSRRGGCHPHPSQTRTCRFPASGSSRESFARGDVGVNNPCWR
jgi:hypothetical protein